MHREEKPEIGPERKVGIKLQTVLNINLKSALKSVGF